ncbi:MAG TPA: hypothetical protein VNI83_12760 [Vicinamibacterales bacterium]|nr:hypothetical protein [Vicinamibacterales bacterium]
MSTPRLRGSVAAWSAGIAAAAAVVATMLSAVLAVRVALGPSPILTRPALLVALNGSAILAASARRPVLMYLTATLAFLPMGLYTLLLPSSFAVIGACNLIYLGATVIFQIAGRPATAQPTR